MSFFVYWRFSDGCSFDAGLEEFDSIEAARQRLMEVRDGYPSEDTDTVLIAGEQSFEAREAD